MKHYFNKGVLRWQLSQIITLTGGQITINKQNKIKKRAQTYNSNDNNDIYNKKKVVWSFFFFFFVKYVFLW
jgi:hypothetical protein